MPHCIIEHSNDIESDPLQCAVYNGAFESGLFESNDIKIRSICYSNHQTGTNKTSFVHVVLKILDGRNSQQKSLLSGLVLNELLTLPITSASFTVDVVDIERACYAKHVRK